MSRIKSREEGEEPLLGELAGRWFWHAKRGRFMRNRRRYERRRWPRMVTMPHYGPGVEDIIPLLSERESWNNGRANTDAASTGHRRDAVNAGNGEALPFRGETTEGGSGLCLQTPLSRLPTQSQHPLPSPDARP